MKAHRTDTLSLVFGLLFIVVAGGFLAESYFDLELPEVGWFIAAGVIFIGVVTAAGALLPDRQPKPAPVLSAPGGQDAEPGNDEQQR
jgi:membrane protease YdiL (CAAX protease family)